MKIFEKTSKVLATTYGTFLVLQILFPQSVMTASSYLLGVKKVMVKILVASFKTNPTSWKVGCYLAALIPYYIWLVPRILNDIEKGRPL